MLFRDLNLCQTPVENNYLSDGDLLLTSSCFFLIRKLHNVYKSELFRVDKKFGLLVCSTLGRDCIPPCTYGGNSQLPPGGRKLCFLGGTLAEQEPRVFRAGNGRHLLALTPLIKPQQPFLSHAGHILLSPNNSNP